MPYLQTRIGFWPVLVQTCIAQNRPYDNCFLIFIKFYPFSVTDISWIGDSSSFPRYCHRSSNYNTGEEGFTDFSWILLPSYLDRSQRLLHNLRLTPCHRTCRDTTEMMLQALPAPLSWRADCYHWRLSVRPHVAYEFLVLREPSSYACIFELLNELLTNVLDWFTILRDVFSNFALFWLTRGRDWCP